MATVTKMAPECVDLVHNTLLQNGTIVVSLRTLDSLEEFWRLNRDRFPYSCQSVGGRIGPTFLRNYQWVFGSSKQSVVETVLRLGQSSVTVEFHHWKTANPGDWREFFECRSAARRDGLLDGTWTAADEDDWLAKTPDTYEGWWRFENIGDAIAPSDWFACDSPARELYSASMPAATAAAILCEDTFDEWLRDDTWGMATHDPASIEETIAYWQGERAQHAGYYGDENETDEIV